MRDPRLVEIDFLMDLEQSEQLRVTCTGSSEDTGVTDGGSKQLTRYGLDPTRFHAMVLDHLLKELIVGFERVTLGEGTWEHHFTNGRALITSQLMKGDTIYVHISHAGRVHLWTLRDALLRDADLDVFGLRTRAAWDRDLFVQLRWATPEAPLSIMFLDLDHFREVNNKYGHPVGDAVLRAAFGLIKSVVSTRGVAYRYGGEEVGVLLPGLTLESAALVAEELRATIERETHVAVTRLEGPQTASIGVAAFITAMENDVAVATVDALTYAAKHAGRNCVRTSA